MTIPEGSQRITEEDLTTFAEKLEAWGKGLPAKERALLELMLARAEGVAPEDADVQGYSLPSIAQATSGLLGPLVSEGLLTAGGEPTARGDVWAQMGELWIQRQN